MGKSDARKLLEGILVAHNAVAVSPHDIESLVKKFFAEKNVSTMLVNFALTLVGRDAYDKLQDSELASAVGESMLNYCRSRWPIYSSYEVLLKDALYAALYALGQPMQREGSTAT